MLPSTGYFKGNSCPFYDNGLCERPYCHFRHVKKESQNINNDGIESGAILQKLVSAAVQKVLLQKEASGATTVTQPENTVNQVPSVAKVTYNPTPISELNKINNPAPDENNEEVVEQRKRHIPVPYTPRKPAGLPLQRPIDTNGASKPFIYIPPPLKYTPGSTENVQCDKYTPTGSTVSTEKYLPGSETELQQYNPNEGSNNSSKHNYVPSDKNTSKKKILEYKPTKVSSKSEIPSVTYQPTPRSLAPCFSSDEDEPENKKRKLSSDLNGLDDLGPEFDMLDQILDEEKPDQHKIKKDKTDSTLKTVSSKSSVSNNNGDNKKTDDKNDSSKSNSNKNHDSKSHHKSSSDRKDKSKSEEKTKQEEKSKSSDHKSKHKSSSRDKEKEKERKDKDSSEKNRHSSSRSSERSSKHSSSKKHDSKKHSSNSKHKSKTKDKSDHKSSHKSSKESKNNHDSSKNNNSNNLSDNDNDDINIDELMEEEFDQESDEDAIALECKKIFDEYVPVEKPKIIEDSNKIEDTNEEEIVVGKKRISRAPETVKAVPKAPIKPDFKLSAAQAMAQRLAKVRDYHSARNANVSTNNEKPLLKSNFTPPTTGISKIRIAHVPYASTLVNAKKTISPSQKLPSRSEPSTSATITQTVKKGAQRVAHVPNEKFIDRPGVLEPLGSKIPANIRSTYLNMMIDECLKLYLSAHDAYARAQHEELTTSKKCSTVQIYKNSAVLAVSRLRKESQESKGVKKSASDCSTLQKVPGMTPGKPTGSWSIEGKNRKNADNLHEFVGAKLYSNIKKWILTEEQLRQNGFPRPHESGQKGKAIIYGKNKQKPPKGVFRTCCRCKKDYTVDKFGFAATKEECIYHPNNKYRIRGEARYQCCSQDGTSDGCCVAPSHVYEYVDFENLKGFVKTLPPEKVMDDYGVYALDCEMCYTTHGLDLTRVTVINSSCKVIYETLIRPLHPIIDYNTRYSGITEEQMQGITTTLLDVQATLLTMFNSNTILIGHSLESDFKVLKLIHDTVIDTSVLFPHKMGPPYKRALRNLSSEHLKKIIQNSVDGHDSAEDATVCMELIHYKLKEDLKTR